MKKTSICVLMLMLITVSVVSCTDQNEKKGNDENSEEQGKLKNELIINAGAGLKSALDIINAEFTRRHGTKFMAQYMCSAMVLSNLLLARDTDVFFPGSEYFMNIAVEKGAINREEAFPAAYMVPVITTPKGNPKNIQTLEDMAQPGIKVAWGELETLAVGRLTEKMLKALGLFEKIKENVVYVGPSATKLQVNVALGSVDAAINWKATVLLFADKSELIAIPLSQLKYSIAPCGLSTFTKNRELARKYVAFIKSPEGQKIFEEQGYTLPEGGENLEKVE